MAEKIYTKFEIDTINRKFTATPGLSYLDEYGNEYIGTTQKNLLLIQKAENVSIQRIGNLEGETVAEVAAELYTRSEIFQTEIDFGELPVYSGEFTIENTGAEEGKKIVASLAYDAPTGKDLDELEMDELSIKCGSAISGFFQMLVRAVDGSYLHGKFKINYTIN